MSKPSTLRQLEQQQNSLLRTIAERIEICVARGDLSELIKLALMLKKGL